ncbi:trans-aconitate 2-methyltransferase [Streptomyces albireticuli]|uniref:Trans-aconitate 2-methyltransferase n=1 Tax=Streptomyces albireticuli TaxID=1940 RepID=A0A2A2D535_9ACTN|nr:trans-aconitate 2-methyltransferase [Streptomyces albireticuli]MCD9144503.1 trans-aconitate 2-methyltransferase [Streptomyces albireticuli]MCD9163434.1 trans-aconitate 2-methyltransferase [Streptomyces albireticuli]MCD9193180.1 trans-aconitate 2-methyltransferase [Streptomyces albireticuli]PAU46644.1 trans-aconitate methyltransferase [Streptomyces albireticuli]
MRTAATWDPRQYLRHSGHRARPFHDLLARIPDPAPRPGGPRVVDLGCGSGNVTALLAARWPTAHVTGLDSSPEMLAEAAAHAGPTPGGGRLDFARADLTDWTPAEPLDLIVSSATLQRVPGHAGSFPAWTAALTPGGTLAFTVPGNFRAPSHTLLRELCGSARWRDRLGGLHGTGHVLEPADYLGRLTALGLTVDAWETTYSHLLTGPDPVLDWTKGTALRPVLTALSGDPGATEEFLASYAELLRGAYAAGPHGTVFPFRRVFVVARRPA